MHFVVDQNFMRKPQLRELLVGNSNIQLIVPDCALEEMVRLPKWEATIQQSFRIMASAMHRTFFSASIGELLRYELEHLTPISRKQLLPPELTVGARAMITAILGQGTSAEASRLRVVAARRDILGERAEPDQVKAKLVANLALLKGANGERLTREIRSGRMSEDARLGLLKLRGEEVCQRHFGNVTGALRVADFLTTRFVYASLWYQEFWLNGGLDDAKPKTLANDEFDMEYALIASFFGDLLSEDRRAKACAVALRRLTDPATEEVLFDALEKHAIATGRMTQRP
ncbi:hypothetical protein [Agrobacterium burrii]|uniref:DUF4935 domain-containing protein n=1 Tax=Agrobacterium burrii TaxID=2815339 RepID=A0ABS3EPZ7_9HYPH|nr:hypothetical protein [Agrobacterium burrii]MBO0134077.1 hypothetical protein [Agrobacterium burrii]